MRQEKLSNLCKISNGYAFKSNDYVNNGHRVIRITNVQKGYVVDNDPKFIPNEVAAKAQNFKLNTGDILISLTGNVGRVGRVLEQHLPAVLNQRVGLIRPISPEISENYLFQILNSYKFEREAIQNSNGVAQMNLSSKWIESYEIPLPPLNDQIRIAHLLGKIEGLIAQRKQHLQQLDDLLKSVFFEMFGDPVRNEKDWDKKPFRDLLVDIESGKSPKCEARPATGDEWGVLKLGAVTSCVFNGNENKALPAETLPTVKHEVKAGDLLFSRKNTYELVAACAYVYETRPRLLMPDLIFRFVFKEDALVNPIYVWKLLTNDSQRKAIQAFAAGAAGSMPNISKTNLKTVQLAVPPIELQNRFSAIVDKVEALKSHYQKSLADLELLYGALAQHAFKGDLDLSRVPSPDVHIKSEEATPFDQVELPKAEDTGINLNLPDTDYLIEALTDSSQRKRLLGEWLESYCQQTGNSEFSTDDFLAAVQASITELHPDKDFKLGAVDYDIVKHWIFGALAAGKLSQSLDEETNRLRLNMGKSV